MLNSATINGAASDKWERESADFYPTPADQCVVKLLRKPK